MRIYHHVLEKSKSGKSIIFRIHVSDISGERTINFASLQGWRARLAEKQLFFDQEDWSEDLSRKFVGMMALKAASDQYQGTRFLNHIKEESSLEITFWASQFLKNRRAPSAWKILNGDAG